MTTGASLVIIEASAGYSGEIDVISIRLLCMTSIKLKRLIAVADVDNRSESITLNN